MHIANVYHKDMHDGIGMPPLAKYEEGILGNSGNSRYRAPATNPR